MYTVSQKTSHLWLAITLTHVNALWYFFGWNVTDKVSNQKTLYCATSNNVCFCITWQKRGNTKIAFFTQMLYCQNSTSRCLISSIFLTHTHAAVWLLVINAFSSGLLRAWFRRKEVDSAATVGLCCTHNACAPMRCLPERKEVSSVMCFIVSNICLDSKISY